ncbi:hypothetical protein K438DRAFT_719073 [Mycena galopus ATCC 62051]|nr:hypothetical protein K438DRAFT_719073 [Mycena galopus ATCC 62051]
MGRGANRGVGECTVKPPDGCRHDRAHGDGYSICEKGQETLRSGKASSRAEQRAVTGNPEMPAASSTAMQRPSATPRWLGR